jgi:transcriptional regulator with XRE-family HTH domain
MINGKIMTASNKKPRINNCLRQCRKALGYTQKDVAYMLNVKPRAISNWEREITHPSLANVLKLSYVYNRLVDYLYYDFSKTFRHEIKVRRAKLFPPNE